MTPAQAEDLACGMVSARYDARDSDAHIVVPCLEHKQIAAKRGYGNTSFENRHTGLHRMIYCLSRRVPLESIGGRVIRHDCDNTRCIEPLHLRIGTQKENVNDTTQRGRARGGIARGEENRNSKLSNNQVLEIRERHAAGGVSNRRLAAEYGVTPTMVGGIVRRLSWRHI